MPSTQNADPCHISGKNHACYGASRSRGKAAASTNSRPLPSVPTKVSQGESTGLRDELAALRRMWT